MCCFEIASNLVCRAATVLLDMGATSLSMDLSSLATEFSEVVVEYIIK